MRRWPTQRDGRRLRRLQARLLGWFLAAIVLAIGASVLTTVLTADEPEPPTRVVTRHVVQRVQRTWDDPVATDAYIAELRDTTGLDIRVRRDPSIFSGGRRIRQGGIVFDDGVAYVPIMKRNVPVGALEIHTGTQRPRLWRVALALLAALFVLGMVARRISMRLSRPLEHLAATAERFGSGDLSARTGIEKLPNRWVAEEVRDVGRAFDTMAERVGRVVVEQRELLAAISHELRSPLGRAKVALEIARERSEGEPDLGVQKPLADIERQLDEVDTILGDLLASERAGLADLKRQRLSLASWLGERLAAETTGPIELSASALGDVEVDADAALLGRAVHNVVSNAWAHGHPSSEPLVVTASADDATVRIEVRDRGPGFSDEILPRAFDAFVTGSNKARSPGAHGMGLGLALVRRIIEAHGGTASAKNADDGPGAIVTLTLPRAARA